MVKFRSDGLLVSTVLAAGHQPQVGLWCLFCSVIHTLLTNFPLFWQIVLLYVGGFREQEKSCIYGRRRGEVFTLAEPWTKKELLQKITTALPPSCSKIFSMCSFWRAKQHSGWHRKRGHVLQNSGNCLASHCLASHSLTSDFQNCVRPALGLALIRMWVSLSAQVECGDWFSSGYIFSLAAFHRDVPQEAECTRWTTFSTTWRQRSCNRDSFGTIMLKVALQPISLTTKEPLFPCYSSLRRQSWLVVPGSVRPSREIQVIAERSIVSLFYLEARWGTKRWSRSHSRSLGLEFMTPDSQPKL